LQVAPRAGAWIETIDRRDENIKLLSPPARGRGLKQKRATWPSRNSRVAPRAGAWIETKAGDLAEQKLKGRPPRGGVD